MLNPLTNLGKRYAGVYPSNSLSPALLRATLEIPGYPIGSDINRHFLVLGQKMSQTDPGYQPGPKNFIRDTGFTEQKICI
jgi:hypothetical protein